MSRVLLIAGASRGIGWAIAYKFARETACIFIAAKIDSPPSLERTIHTVAKEIEQLGDQALPLIVDVCGEEQIKRAIKKTASTLGKLELIIFPCMLSTLMFELYPDLFYDR